MGRRPRLAHRSRPTLPAWLLFVVVTLWIGGFDLIYAIQDIDVDRREGLYSIPATYGVRAALRLSAVSHALMTVLLAALLPLGWPTPSASPLTVVLLAYEHAIVASG